VSEGKRNRKNCAGNGKSIPAFINVKQLPWFHKLPHHRKEKKRGSGGLQAPWFKVR
jgi:hypothetical protein